MENTATLTCSPQLQGFADGFHTASDVLGALGAIGSVKGIGKGAKATSGGGKGSTNSGSSSSGGGHNGGGAGGASGAAGSSGAAAGPAKGTWKPPEQWAKQDHDELRDRLRKENKEFESGRHDKYSDAILG